MSETPPVVVVKAKSGLKTTEFWLTVAVALLPILDKYFEWELPIEKILVAVGAIATYTISRSIAKKNAVVVPVEVKRTITEEVKPVAPVVVDGEK